MVADLWRCLFTFKVKSAKFFVILLSAGSGLFIFSTAPFVLAATIARFGMRRGVRM